MPNNLDKLNEIIDFLKSLDKKYFDEYNTLINEMRFSFSSILTYITVSISVFAMILSVSVSFNLGKEVVVVILSIVMILTLILFFSYRSISKSKMEIFKNYVERSTKINVLIESLQLIKISEIEVDISGIIKNIENRVKLDPTLQKIDEKEWFMNIIAEVDRVYNSIQK